MSGWDSKVTGIVMPSPAGSCCIFSREHDNSDVKTTAAVNDVIRIFIFCIAINCISLFILYRIPGQAGNDGVGLVVDELDREITCFVKIRFDVKITVVSGKQVVRFIRTLLSRRPIIAVVLSSI